jgi:dihydroorotate dehydrogenase electron transfer subunit
MAMLQAVQSVASAAYDGAGIPTQLSVEESMACGIGVCMTCVLPIIGNDGQTRMARSCADGPVFSGERIRWDALGTVPDDAVGAQQ